MRDQEKIKEILEQLRSKANGNNVAKVSVEENAVGNVNVSMSVQGSTDEIRSELSADEVEISVNATNTIDGWRDSTDESDWTPFEFAPIGLFNGLYHTCYFKINATAIKTKFSISNNDFKCGRLALTFSNESSGMKVFDFYNVNGECVGSWWQEISIMDVYDESNDWVELIVVPANGCTGMIIVDPTDFTLVYTAQGKTITGISITTPPNKKVYLVGETFDPSGMVVTATYSDGSTAEVTGYYSPDTALTASDTSITISYTEGDVTKTATQTITVYPMTNVYYGDNLAPSLDERNLQSMDIYIPKNEDETYKEGPFPAVITIHGGNWSVDSGVTKGYYNYMTAFITGDCDCVHVNMEYRRMGAGGGLDMGEGADAPYEQMLDDIQSAISYLQSHADIYHIDDSKIALMGHSAGGHLALLYAYSTAGNYDESTENPVKLVISEAGPSDFTNFEGINTNNVDIRNGFMLSLTQLSALTGAEYTIDNYENNTEYPDVWEDASPIYYVSTNQGNNFPYTILAYGSNVNTPQGNNPFISGDSTVAYSQATSLVEELDTNKYTLFTLNGVDHNTFGVGKIVYPGATSDMIKEYYSCNNVNKPGLKQLIDIYLLGNTNTNN